MMLGVIDSARSLASKTKRFVKNRIKKQVRGTLERSDLSKAYLKGNGIEIGALHNPLKISKHAKVKYVDRMLSEDLRKHYPELRQFNLVNVDIVDNGETLSTINDNSQDFVVANHFVEHCQNPIGALCNMFRVLKEQGVLFIALPDKRFTFDCERPVTSFAHLLRDFHEGAEQSKLQHFQEWVELVDKVKEPQEASKKVNQLMKMDYSIHFHVWTQTEMLELFLSLKKMGLSFDIEACLKNEIEFILILRKLAPS